ncbi:hypothetical protein [Streptomyces sp. NPDC098781]|uniref:hypothetical protein n=1 Tax=Streptomyces sp. NPDC098781 TaxID=3366097 RepID=UPI00381834ED
MTGRRRLWRRVAAAWLGVVVVAGGLTLWLRDSAEPPEPHVREEASPTPSLPEGWESACAGAAGPDGKGQALCIIRTR